jgi:hypothetical protein
MAETVKHTPGPWHVDPKSPEESFFEDVNVLRHDGLAVAVCVQNGDILPPEPEANARLIAAAPDLLVALADLLHSYSEPDRRLCCDGRDCGCMGATVQQQAEHYARAAIAKAEGK